MGGAGHSLQHLVPHLLTQSQSDIRCFASLPGQSVSTGRSEAAASSLIWISGQVSVMVGLSLRPQPLYSLKGIKRSSFKTMTHDMLSAAHEATRIIEMLTVH